MKAYAYKLRSKLDIDSVKRLYALKEHLEATSDIEVVRRALRAYDVFDVDPALDATPLRDYKNSLCPIELTLRLPESIRERMEARKAQTGESYADQLRKGLTVLTQLTRDLDSRLEKIRQSSPGKLKLRITDAAL